MTAHARIGWDYLTIFECPTQSVTLTGPTLLPPNMQTRLERMHLKWQIVAEVPISLRYCA